MLLCTINHQIYHNFICDVFSNNSKNVVKKINNLLALTSKSFLYINLPNSCLKLGLLSLKFNPLKIIILRNLKIGSVNLKKS